MGPTAGRRRDAAGSRRALLTAARELFGEHGYGATTVRMIAERAGVNQALLFRYFGSKAALFSEAIAGEARELLASTAPADLLEHTLGRILSTDPGAAAGPHPFLGALRSAGQGDAADAVRAELGAGYGAVFASLAATDDPADAAVRADLLLAWLLGIALLRSLLVKEPLAGADPEVVTAHVRRAARELLGVDTPGPGS